MDGHDGGHGGHGGHEHGHGGHGWDGHDGHADLGHSGHEGHGWHGHGSHMHGWMDHAVGWDDHGYGWAEGAFGLADHSLGAHMEGHAHGGHHSFCCAGQDLGHGAHPQATNSPGNASTGASSKLGKTQNYRKGHYSDIPAFQRLLATTGQKPVDEESFFPLPGLRYNDRRVEMLVWPHRQFDVRTKVRQLAALSGMYDLAAVTNGIVSSDQTMDNELVQKPLAPAGSYPDVTGSTRVWTEYWKIPLKKPWRWPWQKAAPSEPIQSYLIISGFTWHYAGTDDYETQVSFFVYTPWEEGTGYPYRPDEVKAHRALAGQLAERLYDSLMISSPDLWSMEERCRIADRQSELKKQAQMPKPKQAARPVRRGRLP